MEKKIHNLSNFQNLTASANTKVDAKLTEPSTQRNCQWITAALTATKAEERLAQYQLVYW